MRYRLTALLLLWCALAAGPPLHAQQAGLRAALEPPLQLPTFSLVPLDALFQARPFDDYVAEWAAATRAGLTDARTLLHEARLAARANPPAVVSPGIAPVSDPYAGLLTTGRLTEHADLGIAVTGAGNLGGAWSRFTPCDPTVQYNCNPNLFPQLTPEVQFGVRVGGTISDRIHVDVDYDQTREFDAANNINVYYQGLPDEVLQRIEIGDVSIRLPSSRYMTRGVPAGNFGLMASGQLGRLRFQTVFAQQKGDITTKEFRLGTGGLAGAGGEPRSPGVPGQPGLEQDAQLVVDDADYVRGQFFFLVPPSELAGYPHIDVLSLRSTDASAAARPGVGGSIKLYRDERLAALSTGGQSAQLGYFLAAAVPPGGGARHTGSFRRLVPELDYTVHASGLWIVLRSPLRPDEALAASFVTESGDTAGALNAESAPAGVTPELQLLRGPASLHQPGAATWPMEMRQVYRLDSSTDVDLESVDLRISLGGLAGGRTSRDALGRQLTLLRFFGLDEDAPADRLDAAQVFRPSRDAFDTGTGAPIGGTFIVFPTLRPFAAPAPVTSERLTAEELQLALGGDANEAIYDDPDPVRRDGAALFRLNFDYRVRVAGLVTSFNLGAFGIREGSERITFGGRTLVRDIDYSIDYEIGTVMLLSAQSLLATSPDAEIRATWEQKPIFSIAPTTVFGASASYSLGTRGELNFAGLHQLEKSIMTRPQLGVEPGAALVGGASGRFELGGALLDRMLGGVPGLRSTGGSSVSVTTEVAFSMPNPNRRGAAYLDDFEGSDGLLLSVRRQAWKLGSVPTPEADAGTLPFTLDATTAAPLIWQHDFLEDGSVRGALLPSTQIDRRLNVVGTEVPEPVMWLTFGGPSAQPAPAPDDRGWRSLTTVLSTTGRDMTRSEYIELYVDVRSTQPLALILDVGAVGEDAFYIDDVGNTSGVTDDGRPWGLGELDEEARLIDREVWGAESDRRGLWGQSCVGDAPVTYALGDPRANCTRNNGLPDSEDLDGNGILDPDDGPLFRYVVDLEGLSEYLVRDTAATGTPFRLYRIPLRSGAAVNGADEGTWRFIRHLRMTFAGESDEVRTVAIARMRIVGSRWTKRDIHGVQRGLLDAEPGIGGAGTVRVGPVSRLTDGALYVEPPGVSEEAQDPASQFGGGVEINEKSMRLGYTALQPGERAEVYYRYPQQPRNMLMYRELRLWVMAREGTWGPGAGGERFTVRVGTDPKNFYLYQSPLRPATGPRAASPADWLPEMVIDVQQWLELKVAAERRLIERGSAGIDTLWSADSTYALVLEDRARAPNLAAVRELAFAIYNGGNVPATGEVWIDELRVAQPDTKPGAAGNIALDLRAGDFGGVTLSFANQGALFRELNQTPHYLGATDFAATADARLDRLLPESWGLDLPVSISHHRNGQAPTFLSQSDVMADRLEGLRDAGSDATRIGLRISRGAESAQPLVALLVDGSALRLAYNTGSNRSVTSLAESTGFMGDYSYRHELVRRDIGAMPGFFERILRVLASDRLERSDVFARLVGSRLRWSPATLALGSTWNDQLTRSFLYDRILTLPSDGDVVPIESPRRALRNDVQLGLQPFDRLTAAVTLESDRDMLSAARASTRPLERQALERARSGVGGLDLGWETGRMLSTSVSYQPELTRWLSGSYTYHNRYLTDRNASWLEVRAAGADTTTELQRRFESTRQVSRRLQLQPAGLIAALGVDSASVLSHWQRIDFGWRSTLSSQFERETFTPSALYQVGIGGLAAFTFMEADTAARAQQRETFTAGTAVRLVGDALLNVDYSTENVESFDPRGGSRTQQRVGWPHVTVQWSRLGVPRFMSALVRSWGASFGVQRNEATTRYGSHLGGTSGGQTGGGSAQTRGTTELRFPLSLNIGLAGGVSLSYRGAFSAGETLDPTGNVEDGGYQQDLGVTGVFQPPDRWRTKLNGPITARFAFAEQQLRQCRYNPTLAGDDGCIAFLDLGTRNANFTLETLVSDITVGALFNYVSRQSQGGTRNGSTQFQLGLYGRFNFTAGVMPAGF